MKSTGEVMGLDASFERAFAKAQLGAGVKLPESGRVFLSVRESDKHGLVAMARRLIDMGFAISATSGTARRIAEAGLPVKHLNKVLEGRPHCVDAIRLVEMGFTLLATRGTAATLRAGGTPARTVNKVLEGRPHCVDAIRSGDIQLVINTAGGAQSLADSYDIRRSALTHGVPHYTTIAGARAAVHAIAALKAGTLEVAPLQSYFRGSF